MEGLEDTFVIFPWVRYGFGNPRKGDSFTLQIRLEVYEFFGRDVYVPKEHVFFFCTQEAFQGWPLGWLEIELWGA